MVRNEGDTMQPATFPNLDYELVARPLIDAEQQASAIGDRLLAHLLRMALLHLGQRIAVKLTEPGSQPVDEQAPEAPLDGAQFSHFREEGLPTSATSLNADESGSAARMRGSDGRGPIGPDQCRKARETLSWTRRQLAEAASVPLWFIAAFEDGKDTAELFAAYEAKVRKTLDEAGIGFASEAADGVGQTAGVTYTPQGSSEVI